MGFGVHWKDAAAAARREADDTAAERGLGEHLLTRTLGGGNAGCAGVLAGIVLLLPGIGLIVGADDAPWTGIGIALVVLAVAVPATTLWFGSRTEDRLSRLHVFDGGLVLTGPPATRAYPWPDLVLTERTDRGTYGSGATPFTAHRVEVRTADGEVLCTLGANTDEVGLIKQLSAD